MSEFISLFIRINRKFVPLTIVASAALVADAAVDRIRFQPIFVIFEELLEVFRRQEFVFIKFICSLNIAKFEVHHIQEIHAFFGIVDRLQTFVFLNDSIFFVDIQFRQIEEQRVESKSRNRSVRQYVSLGMSADSIIQRQHLDEFQAHFRCPVNHKFEVREVATTKRFFRTE